jgi:hypothetical protein
MEIVAEAGEAGYRIFDQFAADELVGSLLLLYGLHPEDFETRVRRAIDSVPYLELAGTDDGVVRVRSTSASVSREAVEQIIYSAAPEATAVHIEAAHSAASSFVPVEALLRA